jgi:hypothetical protein
MAPVNEIRESDGKGRITLPKGFANSTLLVEVVSDKELVIRKAKVVPLADDEEDLPPLPFVAPLSDEDRDLFIAVLDNPPPPTDSLKRALAAAKARTQK